LLIDPAANRVLRERLVPMFDDDRQAVLVELNLRSDAEPDAVRHRFFEVFARFSAARADSRPEQVAPEPISTPFLRCLLSPDEISGLLKEDTSGPADEPRAHSSIFRIWPDYILRPHLDRSLTTVKADAALRTYHTTGTGVVWAVIDSGIDGDHAHFSAGTLTDPAVRALHRDYTYLVRNEKPPADGGQPLQDSAGHGTHVAGIIAGRLPPEAVPVVVGLKATDGNLPLWAERHLASEATLAGVAPHTRLVSLRVLDHSGAGEPTTVSSAVIKALEYVRHVNAGGRQIRIHGVNLSLGCEWFANEYAAGQSPLCRELDLLVGTGVVAVVSAGNSGAGSDTDGDPYPHGRLATITDPGNSIRAITVGSTHRDKPHLYGISYDSSKGPTTDGRLKPDLVAPGERITSAATGDLIAGIPVFDQANTDRPRYRDQSGTSMAAAHVSGAVAALLSTRAEYIGNPDEVKRLLTTSATDLGRHEFFQGAGLLDLMRVLATV